MQEPAYIEIKGWCRWLAIFGENRNLYFLPLPSPLFKKSFRATAFLYLIVEF